jgi:hypothetical protein
MSILSSVILGVDGVGYCLLGACMLAPRLGEMRGELPAIAALYPSLFKRFLRVEDAGGEMGTGTHEPAQLVREDLAYRLLAYLLLCLGGSRLALACFWGCGYVYLGLGTCIAEMAIVSNELLQHDSAALHRAVAVLLENAVLAILFMSAAAPHCK